MSVPDSRLQISGFSFSRVVIAFDRGPRRDDRVRTEHPSAEIRVIDDTGQQLGIMPPPQALALARTKGLDLVEISPTAVPPSAASWTSGNAQPRAAEAGARAESTRR